MYMAQIDSWWYFKGDGNGVKNWTAMPSVFPHGIGYVYNMTGWPVLAHNRYWYVVCNRFMVVVLIGTTCLFQVFKH